MIAEAFRQMRPKISQREAARRSGLSDARWRQIVSGYQMVSGQPVPVTAPAETVARMAQVVGVVPQQLRGVGREDAAAVLQDLPAPEDPVDSEPSNAELAEMVSMLQDQVADLQAKLRQVDQGAARTRQRDSG